MAPPRNAESGIVGHRIEELRALAVAAVFAAPAIFFVRNLRRASIRGGSVRLSANQFAEIYDVLVRCCDRLGMHQVPRLYLTDEEIKCDARAYSSWDGGYIVLGTRYVDRQFADSHDVVGFLLAREIGALRLGHTRWWNEALLAYVVRIPILRRPLRRVRAFSRDRYAAFGTGRVARSPHRRLGTTPAAQCKHRSLARAGARV